MSTHEKGLKPPCPSAQTPQLFSLDLAARQSRSNRNSRHPMRTRRKDSSRRDTKPCVAVYDQQHKSPWNKRPPKLLRLCSLTGGRFGCSQIPNAHSLSSIFTSWLPVHSDSLTSIFKSWSSVDSDSLSSISTSSSSARSDLDSEADVTPSSSCCPSMGMLRAHW